MQQSWRSALIQADVAIVFAHTRGGTHLQQAGQRASRVFRFKQRLLFHDVDS